MGFLEDVFVKTKAALDVIGGKAGQFMDVSKLKIEVAEIESQRRYEFEKLGRLIYCGQKKGSANEDEVADKITTIDALGDKLEAIEAEISNLRNNVVCCKCNCKNESGALYCVKCGSKIDDKKICCGYKCHDEGSPENETK
jgi:hypothetical protein